MKLEAKNLNKNFGSNQVLQGISLQAESGKALGLLGRNGAGKTTTIRIIMGVFPPDSGEITIDGVPMDRNKLTIGYLPEERGLYPKKQILQQLIYFGLLKNMTKKAAAESATYWLDRLKMSEHAKHKLDTLSKGNQQKIQLIATLIANPKIVILDEPFSGLDPVNASLLKDVVKELLDLKKIVLFSSHQMNYIEEFCDDIVILNQGKIVLDGNIKEIKRGYQRNKIIVSGPQLDQIKASITEECSIERDKLLVTLKSQQDKTSFILKLASQGFDLDEIKVYEPSLNDIFVEYTEDKAI